MLYEVITTHAGETVTGRADHVPPEMDVDVVPVDELSGDRGIGLFVGTLDLRDRRVAVVTQGDRR